MREGRIYMSKMGIVMALALVLLAGCNEEKKIDYTIEGMEQEQQPQGEEGKSGLEQLTEEEMWKETITLKTGEMEWDGKTLNWMTDIQVNAKITVPQTKQMAVIEVEEPEFDAEYKEDIAGRLFDGEIYYGDYAHLTKKDLEQMYAKWEEGFTVVADLPYDPEREEKDLQAFWKAWENVDDAGDSYTPVEEYTVDEYIGVYEGRLYNLTFADVEGHVTDVRRVKRISWTMRDLYEVCPEKLKEQKDLECSLWTKGDWENNQCLISEEEALKEAMRFVEKLGLDYPVVSFTYPLVWGNPPEYASSASESDLWEVNGYVFSFDLGVDDISFVDYGMEEDYWEFLSYTEKNEERQYSLEARMQVYVTDQGVIRMVADNPLEITGISEGVELLPLDTIKKIMQEKMSEEWETTLRFNDHSKKYFDAMDLIYFRVRDKENPGKYSYVPTWRLGMVTKDTVLHTISIRNAVLINAIDGSLIDFYDET